MTYPFAKKWSRLGYQGPRYATMSAGYFGIKHLLHRSCVPSKGCIRLLQRSLAAEHNHKYEALRNSHALVARPFCFFVGRRHPAGTPPASRASMWNPGRIATRQLPSQRTNNPTATVVFPTITEAVGPHLPLLPHFSLPCGPKEGMGKFSRLRRGLVAQ